MLSLFYIDLSLKKLITYIYINEKILLFFELIFKLKKTRDIY